MELHNGCHDILECMKINLDRVPVHKCLKKKSDKNILSNVSFGNVKVFLANNIQNNFILLNGDMMSIVQNRWP